MAEALRVMTFNIRQGRALDGANSWPARRELAVEVVRRSAPHVLGAQEVNTDQLEALLDAFSGYEAVAGRRYGGLFGAMAPILYDGRRLEAQETGGFWLSDDPDGSRHRAWDAAVPRLCTWAVFRERGSGDRFAVFNTHFDQRGEEARIRSAELVVARLAQMARLPRLFLADLNANEESEPYRILVASGMRDTFRLVRRTEEPSFTYHRFRGARSRGVLGKIDHIFCDDAWTARDAAIVRDEFDGRLPSDHYPVTATLELEPQTPR